MIHRRIFSVLSAVSLLLFATVIVLWARRLYQPTASAHCRIRRHVEKSAMVVS